MPRSWKFRIEDALKAIDDILILANGRTADDVAADRALRPAVLYNLMIVGEAVTHVPEDVRLRHRDVRWDSIRGLRNILAHEYFGVDFDLIWRTVTRDLEPLAESLRRIRDQEPDES